MTQTQSDARQIAQAVAGKLSSEMLAAEITAQSLEVVSLYHPRFVSKAALKEKTTVAVMPATRARTQGRVATRRVEIQVAVIRKLAADDDGDAFNDADQLDPLDLLAERLFDAFCRVDPEVKTEWDASPDIHNDHGRFGDLNLGGYTVGPPEQPSILDDEMMRQDLTFLAVVSIPFTRHD